MPRYKDTRFDKEHPLLPRTFRSIIRRYRTYLIALVVIILLFQLYSSRTTTAIPDPIYVSSSGSHGGSLFPGPKPIPVGPGDLKIALVNSPRYHFEVVTPLLYAFANQPAVHTLHLFATEYGSTRLGVRPILEAQMPESIPLVIRDPKALSRIGFVPDIMILTSCSRDIEDLLNAFWLDPLSPFAPKEIVCLLHESEEWTNVDTLRRTRLKPWIAKGRVTFMVLSPHIKSYVEARVSSKWQMANLIRSTDLENGVRIMEPFIPVFEAPQYFLETKWSNITGPFAAIPGKYEPYRRDYNAIFRHMQGKLPLLEELKATLRLTGYGDWPPEIPPNLTPHVIMHDHLMFPQYFSLLMQSMAMLPAFATHKYFEDRASSTIATSVIAGVPIVATKELLEKYSYLDREGQGLNSWVQEEGEEEIMCWLRVLRKPEEEWEIRKARVKALRKELLKENIKNVAQLMEEVRWRNKKRQSWL